MRLFYDIISDKRDKKKLASEDIKYFLESYMDGSLKDYQMAAMIMAVFINGMDSEELGTWAYTMLHSGKVMDFSNIEGIKVDKHSTGGVGDKISIPLAPVLGALGLKVPMISGRGLGHTGGTLDKLESIPGFNVNLDLEAFEDEVKKVGVSLIGQTPEIAPLDKKLYALRDVTGTVESIPLISSSIMSKKMAEGIDGLILDVKVGNGAFMKTREDAEKLAVTMKGIGEELGKKVTVVFSNMNEPLGYAVGNSLEIIESVEVLKGKYIPQVSELTLRMAAMLLKLHGLTETIEEGEAMAQKTIDDGSALKKLIEIVKYQGGDVNAVEDYSLMPKADYSIEVKAEKDGFVNGINALNMGKALVQLGGGRVKKEDDVDPAVGFILNRKVRDAVKKGDTLYTIYYNSDEKLKAANAYLEGCYEITETLTNNEELILGQL